MLKDETSITTEANAASDTASPISNKKIVETVQEVRPPKSGIGSFLKEITELILVTLFLLIAIRWAFAEARYIPSSSMEPTLQIEDRILVEKVSGHLKRPIQRGEILVFYPPPSEMGGKDLSNNPLNILGRLTGLPFLPYEPAFIKRVVGLPGDEIKIEKGIGVFINGELLPESYIKEPPTYDLKTMGDIGMIARGPARPYASDQQTNQPIKVPEGHLFMMGDNRNNSQDSHVWGFLPQERVIGRACLVFWRRLSAPDYGSTLPFLN